MAHFFFFSAMLSTTHPISLGVILIGMSLIGGIILIKVGISWFFYLLVLVFLGGVIIIIIYMSTLASNEKFYLTITAPGIFFSAIVTYGSLLLLKSKYMVTSTTGGVMVRGSLYESGAMRVLFFLMVYLLLTIVSVVKLVKFEAGPLVARL